MTARLLLLMTIAGGLAGCDRHPRENVAESEPKVEKARSILAKPDPFLMSYNPDARTLSLYALPDGEAHWMIVTPRNKAGEPIGVEHAFMTEEDVDAVSVFYTTASGLVSPRVSLREIMTVNVSK